MTTSINLHFRFPTLTLRCLASSPDGRSSWDEDRSWRSGKHRRGSITESRLKLLVAIRDSTMRFAADHRKVVAKRNNQSWMRNFRSSSSNCPSWWRAFIWCPSRAVRLKIGTSRMFWFCAGFKATWTEQLRSFAKVWLTSCSAIMQWVEKVANSSTSSRFPWWIRILSGQVTVSRRSSDIPASLARWLRPTLESTATIFPFWDSSRSYPSATLDCFS